MKKIYIILAHTGTVLARSIRLLTRAEYTHSSISLDEELNQMYSFGRLNPYNPFVGGFVHEYIDKGTFKRFYKTVVKIYSLEITDAQYSNIEQNIKKIESQKKDYKFNILGMFVSSIHKKIKRDKYFYCAEFVKYLLDSAGVNLNLPELIKPEDFKNASGLKEEYCGLLQKYKR